MKNVIIAIAVFASVIFAEKATINLEVYKNNKNFTVAQVPIKAGSHTFTLMNIKPMIKSDTTCICAIIIDKRKYVLYDIGAEGSPCGLFTLKQQPLREGTIVLKASPSDGKTFIFLSNGKLVSLPGADAFVDTTGKNIYCVWDNEKHFRLTVFDYKNMRVTVPTTDIAQPSAWYSSGMSYYFSVNGEKGYYSVDMITKSVTKSDEAEGALTPVSYLMDFSKVSATACCGMQALKH
jgi:hypothetical protein